MPSEIITGKTSSDIENVDWSTGTVAGPHYANVVRFGSSSSQASQSSGDICRICHCESDPQNPLLTPCYCSGSLKYVHQTCLQQWLTASETNACELCKFPFIMHTKIKPFNEWRSLDMSGVERRRLCCAVLFHCAAALCVIWSLCVLIERAAEEVKRGLIGWPFWTKLAVVTVGLTGGVVFMYIQCRQYLHLCHRWRARNRILLIQNAPEKIHPLSPPSPVLNSRHIPRNNSATAASAMTTNSYNYNAYGSGGGGCGGVGGGIGGGYSSGGCTGGGGGNRSSSITNQNSNYSSHGPLHGQIIANIENNSQNYDRDWTLDDVSQISSFRPCQQGSGSMTPFHDSVHNVLENSRSCSNSVSSSRQDISNLASAASGTSAAVSSVAVTTATATAAATAAALPNLNSNNNINNNKNNNNNNSSSNNSSSTRTNDLDLFKTPSAIVAGTNTIAGMSGNNKYPNSSVFLENRDILNDTGYPKINYRHSSVLMSPDITDNLDKFLGKDLRRYSDTKLLQSDSDIFNSTIFNVALHTIKNHNTNEYNSDHLNMDEYYQQRQPFLQQQNTKHQIQQQQQQQQQQKSNRNIINTNTNDPSLIQNMLGSPQITDIIFENNVQYNPIDLNIHEIHGNEIDYNNDGGDNKYHQKNDNNYKKKSRHSLHGVNTSNELTTTSTEYNDNKNIDRTRLFFKSLPNLSNSCESLIKK